MSAEPSPRSLPFAFALLSLAACGEPERNGPAPIGVSAGSVTVGGVTASGSATSPADTDADTDGSTDGTAGTAGTVSGASMPEPTDSSSLTDPTATDPTLTDATITDSEPSVTDSDPTLTESDPNVTDPTFTDTGTGDGVCKIGEACEGDGLCVQQDGIDGPFAACSHGFSGEACELDIHCQSMLCVDPVGEGGASSYCA